MLNRKKSFSKYFFLVIFLVFSIISISGCSSGGLTSGGSTTSSNITANPQSPTATSANTHFPLVINGMWVYNTPFSKGTSTATISGTEVFAGTTCYAYGYGGKKCYIALSGDEKEVLLYGVWGQFAANQDVRTLTFTPAIPLIKYPLSSGAAWTVSSAFTWSKDYPADIQSISGTMSVTGQANVTVPAGTFTNCYKLAFTGATVEAKYKIPGTDKVIEISTKLTSDNYSNYPLKGIIGIGNSAWLAPNIGWIMSTGNDGRTTSLQSYSL